jgi:pimeloyl-ACP methyl ester carboxylesterase
MTTGYLPGIEVDLYYTIRGEAPVLLLLPGGSANADGSESLANELATRFRVVTYDRRGLSRSTRFETKNYGIAGHAADAARLAETLSAEPAFVFGAR